MRSPQHNSALCWNRPWPQNGQVQSLHSPNIVFARQFLVPPPLVYKKKHHQVQHLLIKFKILLICTDFSLCLNYQTSGLKIWEKLCDFMDNLELQTYPVSRKKYQVQHYALLWIFIKILIKHPSKYKILRSKTVEEVSRTDERVDMGKLICRSTFHRGV